MNVEIPSLDTIIGYVPPLDTVVVDYVNHLDGANSALASHDQGQPIIRLTDVPSWDELPRRIDSLNEFVDGDRSETRVKEISDDISAYAAFYVPPVYFCGESYMEEWRFERLSGKARDVGSYISGPLFLGGLVIAAIGLVKGDTSFDMYLPISLGLISSATAVVVGGGIVRRHYNKKGKAAQREHNIGKAKARKELNIPIPSDGICAALLNNQDYIVEKLDKYRGGEILQR